MVYQSRHLLAVAPHCQYSVTDIGSLKPAMAHDRSSRRSAPPTATLTWALALLLIVCLIECVAEQSINDRGIKSANLVQKANGWRSQRGGSCLSYGHSCWGAHGKRSGKPPASAPDWYLTRLLRRMVANGEIEVPKAAMENSDINAIFRVEAGDDSAQNRIPDLEEGSAEVVGSKRVSDGIPMLDDDMLSKFKFWQIMRAAATEGN